MKILVFVGLLFVGVVVATGTGRGDVGLAPPSATEVGVENEAQPQPQPPQSGLPDLDDDAAPLTLSKQSVKACRDRCSAACTRCMKANGKGCSAKKSSCYMGCN